MNTHFTDMYSTSTGSCSSTTFTDSSANFTPAVDGQTIVAIGCGAGSTNLVTTVQYASKTSLTMAVAAGTSQTNTTYQLWGYSYSFTAIEVTQSTGTVVSGNNCQCEGSLAGADIELDGSASATVTGNTFTGFGANGAAGIIASVGVAPQTISSVSEVGNVVTVTTSTPLAANWQPGGTVAICSTTPACTPSTNFWYGIYKIINANYVRCSGGSCPGSGTGTFSYISQYTGLSCSASCGSIAEAAVNNVIEGNTISMPNGVPLSTGTVALQIRPTGASQLNYLFGNLFKGNVVNGSDQVGGFNQTCMSVQGSGSSFIVDSNTFEGNLCNNIAVGATSSIGTNSKFLNNVLNNVTSAWTGSAQSGQTVDFSVPVATANLSGFGTSPTVPSGAMSTKAFLIKLGSPPGTTGTLGSLTPAAPTGWSCTLSDRSTSGIVIQQTGATTTSAQFTLTGTPMGGDILQGSCSPY
jgi:hypothetical protein